MTAGRSVLGFDIGGTTIKWVRLTGQGDRIEEGTLATPQQGPDSVVDAVAAVHRSLSGTIEAAGVAVPGHVDTASGAAVLVPNLPGDWAGHPLGAQLGERLGLRTALINDARAFAVAELTTGAAAGLDRAVFAVLGTGIGGAVALDGRVLRNDTDSVGEFGHSTVVRDGERCGCGNLGCVEAYAGVRAMARLFERPGAAVAVGRSTAIERLRAACDGGDPAAVGIVRQAAWAVGCAVSNLCVALRIPTVVVGGGLGIFWPEFAAEVRSQLAGRGVLLGPTVVRMSAHGDRAGAVGAALSVAAGISGQHSVLHHQFS